MILWIVLALLSAFLTGVVSIIDRKILLKEHAMEFSAIFSLTNAILVLFLIPFVDFNIKLFDLLFIYLISWFGTLGFLFSIKAIRHMQLSSLLPFVNFSPVIAALLGVVFLNEILSLKQWTGIILLLAGGYMLETRNVSNYREFFRNIIKSRSLHYLFLALLFYSFTSIADRYIITKITDNNTYLFFVLIFIAFNFFLMSSLVYGGIGDIKKGLAKNWKLLAVAGLLTFIYRVAYVYSLSLADDLASVLSVKRLSVLFGVVLAGTFLHEKGLGKKIIATLIMLVGVGLLVI